MENTEETQVEYYSTDFSSIFSISFHYSTYFSSILSKSYHYSTFFSSIFPISFHYSTCLSIKKSENKKKRRKKYGKPQLPVAYARTGRLNQILKRQTSRFHYGSKVPAVTITVFITILEQNR
jgi:hypothetical protein